MENFFYSISVDIGTGSVGWAAINEEYMLLKLNGRDAWGAYLFSDAKTAVARRQKRSQRRRYDRRRERIGLLQDLMGNLVLNVDDSFFIRLKETSLLSKTEKEPYFRTNHYNLFNGDYTDKDYYKEFKTIYHLRNKLVFVDEKADPRLIYLALHHMLKYRGNFLFEGKVIDLNGGMLMQSLSDFFDLLVQEWNVNCEFFSKAEEIAKIIKDKTLYNSKKIDAIKALITQKNYSKFISAFANAILGKSASLEDLVFSEQDIVDDTDKTVKICFKGKDYDEKEDMFLQLADDKNMVLLGAKSIYNAILFDKVTSGYPTISKAMIAKYDKHKKDLQIFKKLMKTAFPVEINPSTNTAIYSEYSKMFRSKKGNNYVNYVGTNINGKHYDKRIAKEDFYDAVSKVLRKAPESEWKDYCLSQIALDDFLPLLNSVDNLAIPYQMNLKEMELILDNQGKYYPELSENKDKIMSILTFKRPYYAGTLKGEYSWCDQTINEKVTPWNFYDLVDTEALSEKFITRMTNRCSIFKCEECLPLNSVIYQSYITLNEINKIKYKNNLLPLEWKKSIFIDVCCKNKKVKVKAIENHLRKKFNIEIVEGDITGLADETLYSAMSTVYDFSKRLDKGFEIRNLDAYEDTIRTLTIFDDEKIRIERIRKQNVYSNNEIKLLTKLRYGKWGRYSRKLLHGILSKEGKSIVESLFDSNKHINELLFDNELGYKEKLPNSEDNITKFDYDRDVKDLYCSPSVKKSIWNTLKIIEEIEKVAKCPPSAIYLEDTHTEKAKTKTKSRTKFLLELYKSIKDDEYFSKDANEELIKLDKNNDKLSKDKLFLWLLQLGRCMYSNEPISITELYDCQIDHIVPRAYIKDDSFENRVLVKSIENQRKKDTLALNPIIIERMTGFWKFLYNKKFIGKKKFDNLTKGEYNENDKIGFINRQLVETSQTIEEVKKILVKKYPSIKICGIRAGLNSCMRDKYSNGAFESKGEFKSGFYKLRSLNNFHHAKDAYLTAVLGQFTNIACPLWGQTKENSHLKWLISNNENTKESVDTLVRRRYGIVVDLLQSNNMDMFALSDDGEYLWDTNKYNNILSTMEKNTCLVVKKKITPSSKFYKETIFGPKQEKDKLSPLKCKNGVPMPTEVYGGYSSEQYDSFAVVKYETAKKKSCEIKYEFIGIPVKVMAMDKLNGTELDAFLKKAYGPSAEIVKKVNKFQLIDVDGHLCYITGSRDLNNAVELIVDSKYEKLLYMIEKNKPFELIEEYLKRLKVDLLKEFIYYYIYKIKRVMPIFKKFAEKMETIINTHYDSMSMEEKVNFVKNLLIVSETSARLGIFDTSLYENVSNKKFDKSSVIEKDENGKSKGQKEGRMAIKIKPSEVKWIDYSRTGLFKTVHKLK